MAKSKSVEIEPDGWSRFERAVDVVAKSPPQHRTKRTPNNPIRQIANAIKRAAEIVIALNDPKWCELIVAFFHDDSSECEKSAQITSTAVFADKVGELVGFHLHLEDSMSLAPMLNAIRMAIQPRRIGGRQLIMHDTQNSCIHNKTRKHKNLSLARKKYIQY